MKRLKFVMAATVAAALAFSLNACAPDTSSAPSKTLQLTTAVDNDTFDPAKLSGGAKDNYWQAVYDTVLKLNYDKIQPEPNLATDFSYDATFTKLTVKLRKDVKFSDGTPLTAEALKVNAIALRDGAGSSSFMMAALKDVQVVDDYTAVYQLKQRDPAFLGYLTTIGGAIGNPKFVGKKEIATTPAGSGPYVLDPAGTAQGTKYAFKRNPSYWNTQAFPYDDVTITPIVEASARVNAIKSGQVNAGVFDPDARQELESSGLKVASQATDWRGLVLADREGKKTPALGDVRVRQAINYALDSKSFLNNVEMGQGTATNQIFIPGDLGYVKDLEARYPYDPNKAKELLKAAGYANGFDLVIPAFDFRSAVQPVMIQQLAAVGIRVKVEQVVPDQYNAIMKSGKYSAYWLQLTSGDAWRNIQKTLPPKATWNGFKTEDPKLTQLIDAAQKVYGDDSAFKTAMTEVGRYVVENAYFAPWYRINSLFVTNGQVAFTFSPWATTPELRTFKPAS